jgi:CheY-like chemotaxis protein
MDTQDDSQTNQKLMVRLLKVPNNFCFEASNGLQAFAMVKRSLITRDSFHVPGSQRLPDAFDVILMDNNMPQMSGIEATHELRKAGFTGPIIGLTGDSDDGEFLRAGADCVLIKPVSSAVAKKAIAEALRRARRPDPATTVGCPVGQRKQPLGTDEKEPRRGK